MGYRVAAHLAPWAVDVAALRGLDPELAVRAWDLQEPALTVLEVWKRRRKDPWPLSDFLNRYHLSPTVLSQLPSLGQVADTLRDRGYGVPGVHGELNVGLELSGLLACRVTSFVTDDEEASCFSVSDAGRLIRVRYLRGDLDVAWQGDALEVYPLVPSDEDPEVAAQMLAKSAAPFLAVLPGVRVHDRKRPSSNLLHGLVLEELTALGFSRPILGLGTWDPPEDLALTLRAVRGADGSMSGPTVGAG